MAPVYDLVLLDADETLFDFTRAARFSLARTLKRWDVEMDEAILSWYHAVNEEYWSRMNRGEITKDELVVRRFADLAAHLDLEADPREMNRQFLDAMGEADFLLEGAEAVCRELSSHCTLAIATNGVARTQRSRLEKSSIRPYISHIVVSEEAGAVKPTAGFFDYAFSLCGDYPPKRVLMVGDSLEADIRGGIGYGLDTCWYNPDDLPAPRDLPIRHIISSLKQLPRIVLA